MLRRDRKLLLIAVCSSLLMILWLPHLSHARASQERVVRKKPAWPNEPAKILSIRLKEAPVELGQGFLYDDDWLKELRIVVINTSDRPIVFISIDLGFPRPQESGAKPPAVYDLEWGQKRVVYPEAPTEEAKVLQPGETVEVKLTKHEYEGLKSFLAQTGYSTSINDLDILVRTVVFEGDVDLKCYAGMMLARDPENPNRWMRAKP
jgi:hypothetical protein